MKKVFYILALCSICLTGCFKSNEPWESLKDNEQQLYFVNQFGASMMSSYYLWNEEIKEGLDTWQYNSDPIAKVREIRYKDASGNDIDKWSQMTDDFASFQGMVTGNTKSTGLEFMLFYADQNKTNVIAVVTFVYPGSPAAEAGLKRGDTIVGINDILLTPDNYKSVLSSTLRAEGTSVLTMSDGKLISLTAKQMYMNPIICNKVIEKGGRKIGYLHFTSFTMKSCAELIEVFKGFKAAGITELVLDLRYNGGGYSITSSLLASMIVPEKEVRNGSIFQRDVYNSILTEAWGEEFTGFTTEFTISDEDGEYSLSTAGANPDISVLHVIMTGNSASASEALICGLMPYMDVDITGSQSGGKYCGGFIVDGPTWFSWVSDAISKETYNAGVKYTDNWGIYVMVSRYADKNGNTPCMPNGFTPDKECDDNPLDGYQLGDENETMLAAVLADNTVAPASRALRKPLLKMENQLPRPAVRIINTVNKPIR